MYIFWVYIFFVCMNFDIIFIALCLLGILMLGILIILILVFQKIWKWWNDHLSRQVHHLGETLDRRIGFWQERIDKHLQDSREQSNRLSESSQKNLLELTKKLEELSATNREIKSIWDRLEGLESILKNPKRRGNLGEYFLEELLKNVFQEWQYALQYRLESWVVDAVLFLSEKLVPIDAKFPVDNYEALLQSEDEASKKHYSSLLSRDIKLRIDETSKYIMPNEQTTDFAFMLIPAEGMYYDIFISKLWDISSKELIKYGFEKKVIVCSPSSFYAYLQTVIQWLKSLQIEQKAKEIQKYVLKLQKDLHSYNDTFAKIWNSLSATNNHYNSAAKRLQIIDTDIIKINSDSKKYTENLEIENTIEK